MLLERRAFTRLEDAVALARGAVGRGAPVRAVYQRRRRPDQVDLFVFVARLDHGLLAPAGAAVEVFGCGAAPRRERAFVAAVGEAIERGFGNASRLGPARSGRYRDLGPEAADPRRFAPFSDEQLSAPSFPFAPFSTEEAIAWVEGFSFRTRARVYLPAEAVYLGSHAPRPHLVGTSSGLAAGATREEALLAALYEVIERDAFMIAWACRRPIPEIDLAGAASAELGDLVERAGRARTSVRAFDLTTDLGVPAYLGVALGQGGGTPSLAVGAACGLRPLEALRRAVLEALHTWNWAFELVAARGEIPGEAGERSLHLHDFADHVYLYAHPWRRRKLAFLLSSDREKRPAPDRRPSYGSPVEELEEAIRRVQAKGYEVLAADLGPEPDWRAGFRVVRVLVPELVPLSLSGARFYRGCRRYFEVPERLGDPCPPRRPEDLYGEPHPFP